MKTKLLLILIASALAAIATTARAGVAIRNARVAGLTLFPAGYFFHALTE